MVGCYPLYTSPSCESEAHAESVWCWLGFLVRVPCRLKSGPNDTGCLHTESTQHRLYGHLQSMGESSNLNPGGHPGSSVENGQANIPSDGFKLQMQAWMRCSYRNISR